MSSVIIVPVRDRNTHLNCFRLYMREYFPQLPIIVVEQADDSKWNKGLLFNAAYKELANEYDYLILHDVDMIPQRNFDYSPTTIPTLLATEYSQFDYGQCYSTFFGGVVGLSRDHYLLVNGFSNQFRGYGAEDDSFYRSFIQKGITPAIRSGNRVECFAHPRPKDPVDYNHNLKVLDAGRNFSEGLSTANYQVSGKMVTHNYTHLKINTIV